MAANKETTQSNRMERLANFFDLERTFIVFSAIYFPLAILFFREGNLEKVLLTIYTFLLGFVGVILLFRFVMYMAKAANDRKSEYGGLFVMYVFQVLIPLLMFKVFGYVLISMVPLKHQGIMCSIKYFAYDLYYNVFNFQHSLSVLIVGSFVVMSLLTLWSVSRKA